MGIIISAFTSAPREFSDTETAAIDSKSFPLSDGNWREHLAELLLTYGGEDDLCIQQMSRDVDDFIDYYRGKVDLPDLTQWHLEVATKLRELIRVGIHYGCDRVGSIG